MTYLIEFGFLIIEKGGRIYLCLRHIKIDIFSTYSVIMLQQSQKGQIR